MTESHQEPSQTTREDALQLAVNVVLSRFRMLYAMTSSIACSAEPNSPARLDSLHVAFEIEQTRNWLEVERCRIAVMHDAEPPASVQSTLSDRAYFPGEGAWSAPPVDGETSSVSNEEVAS